MAKNPKWWKDTDAAPAEEAPDTRPKFDPSLLDGASVSADQLNHEQLDALIAHRQLDTSSLPADATKAAKAEFINNASIV